MYIDLILFAFTRNESKNYFCETPALHRTELTGLVYSIYQLFVLYVRFAIAPPPATIWYEPKTV